MRQAYSALFVFALNLAHASAQTFEVASVKPTTVPAGMTLSGGAFTCRAPCPGIPRASGGPGTNDPGRFRYPVVSLKSLLNLGWLESYFEIVGPDWLDSRIVAVEAPVPPDTTREQFKEMLRNLITDRFKLQYHVETKEVPGYVLVVTKDGPKLKESVAPDPQDQAAFNELLRNGYSNRTPHMDPDRFEIPPRGFTGIWHGVDGGRARITGQRQTMEEFALDLGRSLHSPVRDATGLTAKYDFIVNNYAFFYGPGGAFLPSEPPSGPVTAPGAPGPWENPFPDIFHALQSQLGLKLEPKKADVRVMVVDHLEKTPTGN